MKIPVIVIMVILLLLLSGCVASPHSLREGADYSVKVNDNVCISIKELGENVYLLYYISPETGLELTSKSPVALGGNPLEVWDEEKGKTVPDGFELLYDIVPDNDSQWTFLAKLPGEYQIVFSAQNRLGYFGTEEKDCVLVQVTVGN